MNERKDLAPQPKRTEVENLILTYFPICPFCKTKGMEFTWGRLVPQRMTCRGCGASWEPFLSYDGGWSFIGAKQVSSSSGAKGNNLVGKLYSEAFWKKKCSPDSVEEETEMAKRPAKTVIIREVVKVRCPYCGGLYDEVDNRCPYCGGKR